MKLPINQEVFEEAIKVGEEVAKIFNSWEYPKLGALDAASLIQELKNRKFSDAAIFLGLYLLVLRKKIDISGICVRWLERWKNFSGSTSIDTQESSKC